MRDLIPFATDYREDGLLRKIEGVHELVRTAQHRVDLGVDDLGNSSISGDHGFTGTESLEEAVDLARYGWEEGVDEIADVAQRLEVGSAVGASRLQISTVYDVEGDEPDVDRYLQGDPSSMVSYENELQQHGSIVEFIINAGQHAFVSKEAIRYRGAAILASIEALRTNGYSVGVLAVEQVRPSGGRGGFGASPMDGQLLRYEIPVLEPGQPVNVDTIAFAVMHPSFLRRLIFAAKEAETEEVRRRYGFVEHGGYGIPEDLKRYDAKEGAVVIDKDEGLAHNIEEAERFAKELIEKIKS